MRDLSKKIHDKIKKVEEGKLKVEELEEMVENARELHEKLVILKYKAYEKYGNPESNEHVAEEKEEVVAEVKEEVKEEITAEKDDSEQPAFDFNISKEGFEAIEEVKAEEIKEEVEEVVEQTEEEEQKEAIEEIVEQAEQEEKNVFKDSHVERHEPEDENSLNQKLAEEDEQSLRNQLQNTPVKDLKSEISIAKKFEYITFMFEGKNQTYDDAISVLNSCANSVEAKQKLDEYSTKYKWDLENKSILKFVELVERRYL